MSKSRHSVRRESDDYCFIRDCHKIVKALFDRYNSDRGNFQLLY